jgi:hypothetical protein
VIRLPVHQWVGLSFIQSVGQSFVGCLVGMLFDWLLVG